ncbi:MAG TPA: hypothetical protein VG147_12870 [Solirubrobacteraceae bacterium]|jgi:hypothetical protein|nr:hypothetical protein [Solirubrobacteraceae bacterium]
MPSATEHQSWAQQNKQFYEFIGGSHSQWPDWAMTALFYAAMHEIQAALVAMSLRPKKHETRKSCCAKNGLPSRRFTKAYLVRAARRDMNATAIRNYGWHWRSNSLVKSEARSRSSACRPISIGSRGAPRRFSVRADL